MNTRQKFEKMLFERGMFEDQAKEVMDLAIPVCDSQVPYYKITWDRPADEYPEPFYSIVFLSIKPVALKYIEDNIPNAWFKAIFQG